MRKSIPCPWMSLPFENALRRDRERQRRQREGGQHTDLSARMDTPTLSPAGVGSPLAPPPLDISSMTDMVTELTTPVDRAQLDQEIEDFNVSCPVKVDDALNLFNLPPVAGVSIAPTTTTTTPPFTTTSTRTRPVTSTRTRPVTATATVPTPSTNRPRLVTSTMTRPTTTTPARGRAGAGKLTTASTVTTPSTRSRIAAKQPQRRPAAPSAPFPPPSDDDGDDDNDDRRRGLRRRLDLLNEDAQQRARGRRIRNIAHTNTLTTVYEEGGGRPSVRRTSTRTSSPSPPSTPPRRGRGRGCGCGRARGLRRRS